MKYNIKKNWIASFDFIRTNPIILLPFIITAFLECLALELIYFANRAPLSFIAAPIIRKFFGEAFLHYPANLIMLPKLFYYGQLAIYIFLGVFLIGISINIFKNTKEALPVKYNALIKNAAKNYVNFVLYAVVIVILIFMVKRADTFILGKIYRLISKYLTEIPPRLYHVVLTLLLFLTNIVLQAFLILTVPIIVMSKTPMWKAITRSLYLGFRNFFTIFGLISLPFLIYLPITLMKTFSAELAHRTFPEITLYLTIAGIISSIFIDCFVFISASQFLMDNK